MTFLFALYLVLHNTYFKEFVESHHYVNIEAYATQYPEVVCFQWNTGICNVALLCWGKKAKQLLAEN